MKKRKDKPSKTKRCAICGRFLSKEGGCVRIKDYGDGEYEHE